MSQHCTASGCNKCHYLNSWRNKLSQVIMCWFVFLICINSILQVFKLLELFDDVLANDFILFFFYQNHLFKGIVYPKMKMLSLITHHLVVSNQYDLRSSSEHKLRYFWWNPRAFWPCIDSNATETFKAQKGSKDIIKIVHVTLVVQL